MILKKEMKKKEFILDKLKENQRERKKKRNENKK